MERNKSPIVSFESNHGLSVNLTKVELRLYHRPPNQIFDIFYKIIY
jgi:hypothetical protein